MKMPNIRGLTLYLWVLFRMARPAQLLAISLVYLLGVLIALANGAAFNASASLFGYLVIIPVSMSIHYANEYADLETDRLTTRTPFSGGSGALPESGLPRKLALGAAWVSLILGFGLAFLALVLGGLNLAAVAVLVCGAFFGWMYSLPPLKLAWRGWGELDNAMLGVAYSASIGGIATLVGTPPNLSFARIFQIMFPDAPEISFANWLAYALPVSITFFIFVWMYLYLIYRPKKTNWSQIRKDEFRSQYKALGPISSEEKFILIDFILLAFLWLSRSNINLGSIVIPGWSSLFKVPAYINDGTVAIAMAVILFLIPAKSKKGEKVMDWKAATAIPWHIVLLFGGGFALASGFKESGLSLWVGEQLSWVVSIHPFFIILIICLTMTFLTELTSNTATTEMLLPVLAGLSVSTQINPLLFMLPATLSASMAFMLPVATPPNAIVFGTNRINMLEMARTGFILNILGAIVITLVTYFLGEMIFGIESGIFPEWAVIK